MREKSSIITLRNGNGNTKQPLIFLPDIAGNLIYAKPFLSHISPDFPILGLRFGRSLFKDNTSTDLETIAQRFAQDILASDLKSPYHIAGHSFAGLLAFETACQIELSGGKVGALCLLDCAVPSRFRSFSGIDKPKWVIKNLLNAIKYTLCQFRENENDIVLRPDAKPGQSKTSVNRIAQDYVRFNLKNHAEHQHEIMKRMYQIMVNYEPKPYHGPITLFQARDAGQKFLGDRSKDMGWGDFVTGKIHTLPMPGDHLTMIRDDQNIKIVAETLSEVLLEKHFPNGA